jgi:hypothetical protein
MSMTMKSDSSCLGFEIWNFERAEHKYESEWAATHMTSHEHGMYTADKEYARYCRHQSWNMQKAIYIRAWIINTV